MLDDESLAGDTLVVAHRAGNRPETIERALARADLIELDAHVYKGRIELRHAKVLRPTSRLWEQWYLLPSEARGEHIDDVLAELPPDTPLMVDLKCFTARAARRINRAVPESHPVVVSCRSWWVLRTFRDRPGASMLRSCGNRMQLKLARLLPGLNERVGISVHERLVDDASVSAIRSRTPLLFTWGVETLERATCLVEAGVCGLIVDDLELDWKH
ncbi:MAG: hypothetical protein GY708_05110 [Actinomycetia bacterium]|nr:hypothetical protein [Actinomycetes bacterium]MCP4959468.1 hypothetical protein [Actinomycetes bacterium]